MRAPPIIKKQIIHDLAHSSNARAIARSIIELGQSLDLTVVAEGIETREQCDLLAGWDCNRIKGYWHSRPLPENQVVAFLESHRPPGFRP